MQSEADDQARSVRGGAHRQQTLVLLSGGLDSATALASVGRRDPAVSSLFVDYMQPARVEEREAAERIAANFGSSHSTVCIDGLDIPAGEILGRNAMLVIAALASVEPPATIVLGIHQGTEYWDCSPEFLSCMQALLDGYTSGTHQLLAPFAALRKPDVHCLALDLGLDPGLTYSCELAGGPCGDCASCKDNETLAC
jgi:7-cyano-7-deazaguanine synthase